ncbi:FAD-dependent oxidoreductase [Rhodoferax sp.]|uniref:flavin monoamine oxidase family protein n=1 Tax=Rhodoferax sp. TaxID=50421 RepID=UPI0027176160|nr:FAD-dependent oxidoreductase [Rhodoferax sp.]MDO9199137.1 FAD-dependent oxidoreductase [Rhodoferax sp.]
MAALVPLPVNRVFDVAIVGAGLCGLALARTLTARGLEVQVIEARDRLGGRVRTEHCEFTGQALDLGPAWFWSETEPRIAALLSDLGLTSKHQYDPGDALWLSDPNREPERRIALGGVHAGARRIEGGAARLVEALAAALPDGCVRLGLALRALRDRGAFIELLPTDGHPLRARQVVLALPPRLVHEKIQFDPPLPAAVGEALAATPTWMAAQAKAVTTFAQPFWRTAGHSGNAFVRHAQAVLGEVFDASEGGAGKDHAGSGHAGALGGFVALNPAQRDNFKRGLPLLIDSQLAQLFGPEAHDGHLFLLDWAEERWTCSTIDRATAPEPPQADPLLRQPLWAGRVFLGGSETAAHGAGHMEGALESADRIAHALCRPTATPGSAPVPATLHLARAADGTRAEAIAAFATSVLTLRGMAPERYRLHLTRLLSGQQSELLTQRALLATADQVYSETLARLDHLLPALGAASAEVASGRHALTTALLAPFGGWNKGLLDAALRFNSTSCALSNFPLEHQLDAETLRAATLDLAAAWREFALELNARLLVASGVAAVM